MVQKISRPSPFIISVKYGMNIAWEDRQVQLSRKRGRTLARWDQSLVAVGPLAISNKEGS